MISKETKETKIFWGFFAFYCLGLLLQFVAFCMIMNTLQPISSFTTQPQISLNDPILSGLYMAAMIIKSLCLLAMFIVLFIMIRKKFYNKAIMFMFVLVVITYYFQFSGMNGIMNN